MIHNQKSPILRVKNSQIVVLLAIIAHLKPKWAGQFGVPQRRVRIFIQAAYNGLPLLKFPTGTHHFPLAHGDKRLLALPSGLHKGQSLKEAYRMIGNAVPPPLGKAIGTALMKSANAFALRATADLKADLDTPFWKWWRGEISTQEMEKAKAVAIEDSD
ncbi:hypothetical protein BDK51DRAFT_27608 [Blyttiomyces helicus]|uniref:DNA (cytosine-5-)-methyltransferase n=1 Tax=Blyttiomyces helicus TaxID=388810 RepID=A0A4V1IPY6_9FUNG|nr:hypothetical protein BDK51DRAFT_27608 [Blyttiomyces helicus]|eukprot:RKO84687.1 hypothetical protein BDK51DRAFT_27608 [Blyttiomyces helicus]